MLDLERGFSMLCRQHTHLLAEAEDEFLRRNHLTLSIRALGLRLRHESPWIQRRLEELQLEPRPRPEWTRKRVRIELLERKQAGLELASSTVFAERPALHSAASRVYGSWKMALAAVGVSSRDHDLRFRWTREQVVEELLSMHGIGRSLRQVELRHTDPGLHRAGRKLFGNWRKAIEAAGLDYAEVALADREGQPSRPPGFWNRDQVLVEIVTRRQLGRSLRHSRVAREDGGLLGAACMHFGTWQAAIEAAGLDYSQIRGNRSWTREQVVAEMKRLAVVGGAPPSRSQADGVTGLAAAAHSQFGSWEAALAASGYPRPVSAPPKARAAVPTPRQPKWSESELADTVARRVDLGLSLNAAVVEAEDCQLVRQVRKVHGGWYRGLELLGFDPAPWRSRPHYDEETVLRQIRQAVEQGDQALYTRPTRAHRKLHRAALLRFGTWEEALAAAGIPAASSLAQQLQSTRRRDEVVDRIRTYLPDQLDRLVDRPTRLDRVLHSRAKRVFGSWDAALAAAGLSLDQRRGSRRDLQSKEGVLRAIREYVSGRLSDLISRPSKFDPSLHRAVCKLFGAWNEALRAAGVRAPADGASRHR